MGGHTERNKNDTKGNYNNGLQVKDPKEEAVNKVGTIWTENKLGKRKEKRKQPKTIGLTDIFSDTSFCIEKQSRTNTMRNKGVG